MDSNDPVIVRKGVGVGAGMLGALVARQVIHRFRVRQGKAGQRPGKVEAMLWTTLVGAGASLGRVARSAPSPPPARAARRGRDVSRRRSAGGAAAARSAAAACAAGAIAAARSSPR